MSNPATALLAGYVLNEYRVESVIGAGAVGVTYLATDTNLNLKVALKEYLPLDISTRAPDQIVSPRTKADTETFNWGLLRFLDEARTLESVRHPNIVRMLRLFKSNGTAYMVMEFIEGQSLDAWINTRRPLPQQNALNIVGPLLEGLAVIHKAGCLHRDIKPGNVLIRTDGSPVLLDFGPARAVIGDDQKMTALVSPGYAPVEQFHAHSKHGPWTDLYSVGGVLYWMITGLRPTEAVARLRKDVMTPASALYLAGQPCPYSRAFLDAIDWALKPNAQDRPQSTADLMARLDIVELGAAPERTQRIDAIRTNPNPIGTGMSAGTLTGTPAATTETRTDTAAGRFAPDLLRRIEAEAVLILGPIAPMIVRIASRKATSHTELCNIVARDIDNEKARALFLKKFLNDKHT